MLSIVRSRQRLGFAEQPDDRSGQINSTTPPSKLKGCMTDEHGSAKH